MMGEFLMDLANLKTPNGDKIIVHFVLGENIHNVKAVNNDLYRQGKFQERVDKCFKKSLLSNYRGDIHLYIEDSGEFIFKTEDDCNIARSEIEKKMMDALKAIENKYPWLFTDGLVIKIDSNKRGDYQIIWRE